MAGKLVHFELPAADTARARTFWSGVFGWEFSDSAFPGMEYWMVRTGEEQGGAVMSTEAPDRGPIVYFDSDDIDASLAKVRELGGEAGDRMPVPTMGWFAHCTDPSGNEFGLWQTDPSASM